MTAKPKAPPTAPAEPPASTVAIDTLAALRAVTAENEWRRNRILLLENEIVRMERALAADEQEKPDGDH